MNQIVKEAVAEYFKPVTDLFSYIINFKNKTGKQQVKTVAVSVAILLVASFMVPHIIRFYSITDYAYIEVEVHSKRIDHTPSYIYFEVEFKVADSEKLISKNYTQSEWEDFKEGDIVTIKRDLGILNRENRVGPLDVLCTVFAWMGAASILWFAVIRLWKQLDEN